MLICHNPGRPAPQRGQIAPPAEGDEWIADAEAGKVHLVGPVLAPGVEEDRRRALGGGGGAGHGSDSASSRGKRTTIPARRDRSKGLPARRAVG